MEPTLKIYECQLCREFFFRTDHLRCHVQAAHATKEALVYDCSFCGKKFKRTDHFKNHVKSHEKSQQEPDNSKDDLKNITEQTEASKNNETHCNPLECSSCGQVYLSLPELKIHIRMHLGQVPFPPAFRENPPDIAIKTTALAHDSPQSFAREALSRSSAADRTPVSNLSKGLPQKEQHNRPFPCVSCCKMFTSVGALKTHNVVHTREKPFECIYCGKRMKRKHHMKEHMRIHTGERPYKCSKCGKTFTRSQDLRQHRRTCFE